MQLKQQQQDKRNTVHEIIFTPKEAIQVIEGLAAGVRAVSIDDWNNYVSGLIRIDEFQWLRIRVEEE